MDPVHASGQGVLPQPVHGTLSSTAITTATGLPDQVDYSAFESGDRRFAWLHNPATVDGEGAQFLLLDLHKSANGWDVLDVDSYSSPEDALQAAGRAWLQASGGPEVPIEPVADW